MPAKLDPAARRELVRLMVQDGLPPRLAAARMGVSESTARRWKARASEAPDPLAIAEASIREAQALMASVAVPAPRPATRERPRPVVRERPRPVTRERPRPVVRESPRPVTRERPRPVVRERPRRARPPEPAPVERRRRTRGATVRWRRRRLGGVALTLTFIPVGWVLSAAVFSGGAQAVQPLLGGAPAPAPERFTPALATARERPDGTTLAAHVRGRSVRLYRRPGGRSTGQLRARVIEGQRVPLVLLVKRRRDGWLRVHLPARPNGSLAWVRSRSARLRVNPYRVSISLERHRLTLYRYDRRIATKRVGVGLSLAPTPTGRYFVTDLIKSRDPKGLYGPYAFGLSAFSPVHTTFRGGNGQIGIHGTNLPEALGTDVSQGCIRVRNPTITALAKLLPLGTPVDIRRR